MTTANTDQRGTLRPVLEQRHMVILANVDEIIIYAGSPLIAVFLSLTAPVLTAD